MRRFVTAFVLSVILPTGVARADTELWAELYGGNEVPPVRTEGYGFAYLFIPRDQSYIFYFVWYVDLTGRATGAQIHAGPAGVNGPVIFDLDGIPGGTSGDYWGVLTRRDFRPGGGLRTYEQAIGAMQRGQTYINILTSAHARGEVRGQTYIPR